MSKTLENAKGISPVIATVIIVAISMAVAMSVAFWITGIIPIYVRRDEVRVIGCYIQNSTSAVVYVKNTGSTDITVDHILLNGRLPSPVDPLSVNLKPGEKTAIGVDPRHYPNIMSFKSGIRYDFIVHTTSGLSYPASSRAP